MLAFVKAKNCFPLSRKTNFKILSSVMMSQTPYDTYHEKEINQEKFLFACQVVLDLTQTEKIVL